MYRVMLVDDDVPMLKYLKKMLRWQDLEMESPTTTYSAVKALRLFMEILPDIVVMDIGIPQINGLKLVEKFQEIKPEVRVIFLTCHENFSYAKRAVELNADEYLIKDELTADQLEKSLKSSLKNYRKSQERKDFKKFQGVIYKNKELLKQNFLEKIVNGTVLQHRDMSKMIGIHWKHTDFIIGISFINHASLFKQFRAEEIPLIMYGVVNIAEELAKDIDGMTILTNDKKQLHMIFNFKQTISRNVFDEYYKYLEKLQKIIHQYWKIHISFLFSDNIVGISDIGKEIVMISESSKHYFYNEAFIQSLSKSSQQDWNLNSNQLLDPYGTALMKAFEEEDVSLANEMIIKLEKLCRKEYIDPTQLIENSARWIRFMEVPSGKIPTKDTFVSNLRQCTKLYEVIALLRQKIIQLINDSAKASLNHKRNSRLQMIDQYILDHLSENIYSADMANYLYLNPSYFSRYFKNIAEENFTDYVHNFKMKIAVKLIKENRESIKVIASRLGYSDRSYFSKIFKKYIGHSPGAYKTKKTKISSI